MRPAAALIVYFATKCIGVFFMITAETNNYFSKHYEGFTLQRKR